MKTPGLNTPSPAFVPSQTPTMFPTAMSGTGSEANFTIIPKDISGVSVNMDQARQILKGRTGLGVLEEPSPQLDLVVCDDAVASDFYDKYYSRSALNHEFYDKYFDDNKEDCEEDSVWGTGRTEKGVVWSSKGALPLMLLEVAGVNATSSVLDLGACDGFFDLVIAYTFGAQLTGIECSQHLYEVALSRLNWLAQTQHELPPQTPQYTHGDFLDHDLSPYDVLYYYNWGTYDVAALEDHVLDGLKIGGRFVVYQYSENLPKTYAFDRLKQSLAHTKVFTRTGNKDSSIGMIFTK